MKICPKCGYQRNNKDNITSESECPKCGVIYSKAKQKITPNQATSNKAENISHASETSALSPEERRKIYEEEKFRIEARAKIKKEKKNTEDKEKKKQKEEQTKKTRKGCLSILGVIFLFSIGVSLCSKNTSNYSSSRSYSSYSSNLGQLVTKDEFGDKWAFNVKEGYVYSKDNAAIFKTEGVEYQLNGVATMRGYKSIDPI